MAVLLTDQVLERLRSPKTDEELIKASRLQERAEFHTQPHESKEDIKYYAKYLSWISVLIDDDKKDVFDALVQSPVDTVDFTEGVFSELEAVFNAPDRFIQHNFVNTDLVNDYNDYLKEIKDADFWSSSGFTMMKSGIDSFLIVDLPDSQPMNQLRPEPYYYFLDVNYVKEVSISKGNKVEYIIFKDPKRHDKFHQFDDMFFRTFIYEEGEYFLLREIAHNLGYTPARSFWTTPYSKKSKILKKGPITNALYRLDWLLAKYTFEKHTELWAGFPVDIMYEQKCNYQDAEGNICEDGYVSTYAEVDGIQTAIKDPCPQCSTAKKLLGPGTVLTAPAMADKDDPDLLQGLNRVGADTEALKYMGMSTANLEKVLAWNIIGSVGEITKDALNEMHVSAMFESRMNVIRNIKKNFEYIHSFALKAIGDLRYGPNVYMGSIVNYGEKFFIHSVNTLKRDLKEDKEIGMPVFEIANQQKNILETKYHSNPEMMERTVILSHIEPFKGYSLKEMVEADKQFRLDPIQVKIKLNFIDYIQRFELEFMDIVTFMELNDFDTKIAFIKGKFEDYATEGMEEEQPEEQEVQQNQPENIDEEQQIEQ